MAIRHKGILWFRNDLRIHDNEALRSCISDCEKIIPVYIFDPRIFLECGKFGIRKTGIHRVRFILESLSELKFNLLKLGGNLVIRTGYPEEVLYQIARQSNAQAVYCNRERTDEEVKVQDAVEKKLWSIGKELRFSRGKMLYHTADLPFPISQAPDSFSQYRKEVEKIVNVRFPLEVPTHVEFDNSFRDFGLLPELTQLGFTESEINSTKFPLLRGGENEGLKRLQFYLWESRTVSEIKDSKKQSSGLDYSSRLSPYLAAGCLSPKFVYHELMRFEKEVLENESSHQLFLELLWRDYHRLMAKKHGNAIFKKGGIRSSPRKDLREDFHLFRIWSEGRTGYPFVDAAMRELMKTGYLSNRARRLVAGFLINALGVSWQMGATYFESMLIDYDPCSNWGNWNQVAGIGSDSAELKTFGFLSQVKKYDPSGDYVRRWIPELRELPAGQIHEPFLLDSKLLKKFGLTLGKDYPSPVIYINGS